VPASEIVGLLASYPDPAPTRPFEAALCQRAVLRGPGTQIELTRDAARKRKLFRRTTYWDIVMDAVRAAAPAYVDYSYKERADHYRARLSPSAASSLRDGAGRLVYSTLVRQIRATVLDTIDLFVVRR
jgi:hypothetical protein